MKQNKTLYYWNKLIGKSKHIKFCPGIYSDKCDFGVFVNDKLIIAFSHEYRAIQYANDELNHIPWRKDQDQKKIKPFTFKI